MSQSMEERAGNLSGFRVPPQAVEVEKHVIGAIMLDFESMDIAMKFLEPKDFYLERHQVIFRAAQALSAAHVNPDIIAISEEMKRAGTFDLSGGENYLMEISSEVVSSANIGQHAEIVKDKSLLRKVIRMATMILEKAYDGHETGRGVVKNAEDSIYRLGEAARGASEGLVDMPTALERKAQQLDDVVAGKPNRTRLGIAAIDDIMRGLRFGSLNIVAARPKIGKSALILQAAVSCGQPVPIFSMEMLIEEEIERMMAQLDPTLNGDGLSTAAQIMAKKATIAAVMERIAKYPIEICEESEVTVPYVLAESRRMKRKYGKLGFIMVDYLQMMEATGNFGRRDLEVGSLSKGLKRIGTDLTTPILAAASLSRKCEERDNKRPVESDLRDAGQIESDAHAVIFLYRESKYSDAAKKDEKIKNVTEVNIPINRGGPTGRTLLDFNGGQSWFYPVNQDTHTHYRNFLSGRDFNAPSKSGAGGPRGKSKQGPSDNWGDGDDAKKQAPML